MKRAAERTGLYALYADPRSARRAAEALGAAGIPADSITILSSEPWDEYEFGVAKDRKSWMPWLAALGGALGGLAGYALATGTQRAWPLPTGGMAIVPNWTNGIIVYEVTMLGAILTTLLVLLGATRLPNWSRQLYDSAVSEGGILVGVASTGMTLSELEALLRRAGECEVKVLWSGDPGIGAAGPRE